MKTAIASSVALLAAVSLATLTAAAATTGSASAFVAPHGSAPSSTSECRLRASAFDDARGLPGAIAPLGFFDPLGFSRQADADTLKRYREAEITHGRVAMLAVVGVLAGEAVATPRSVLFGVSGPAITHPEQVPVPFWLGLLFVIANAELIRAQIAFVEPGNVPIDRPGLLRASFAPGDLGFDPLGLKPRDAYEWKTMQSKELSHGRLAMIAFFGMMAQEQVNGRGIYDNLFGYQGYM